MFERVEVGSPSRPWTTAFAFLMNATLLTLAILLPMVRPDQLPALNFHVTTPIAMPMFHRDAPPPSGGSVSRSNSTAIDSHVLVVPLTPPRGVDMRSDRFPSDPVGPIGSQLSDFNIIGVGNLPIASSTNPPPIPTTTAPPRPTKIIVSHLDEGMLIRRVQPIYPNVAKMTHTQGRVVLSALINVRGEIEGLQVISGSPLLTQAAMDAVRQWRYRPYILNGSPIAVQTQVTVNFSLQ